MEQRQREHARAQARFPFIKRYLASTLPQTTFCEQEDLTYLKFIYRLKHYAGAKPWRHKSQCRRRLKHRNLPRKFISLRIAPAEPAAPSSTCEIEFSSGVVVRFQGPVASSVLAQLIRAERAEP